LAGHGARQSGQRRDCRFASGQTTDAATLLQEADIAMHAAKVSGKGRVGRPTSRACANSSIDQLQLAADLRHAVERRELVVIYQPIVDLREPES
jgi:predicted signal transduction protein with EAL and GGDEF domain